MAKKSLLDSKPVMLECLGICEHCGEILNIEGMPIEAMDAVWKCPVCKGVITEKTFGYETTGDKCKKIRWVGKDGEWTETEPTRPFEIKKKKLYVLTQPPPLY